MRVVLYCVVGEVYRLDGALRFSGSQGFLSELYVALQEGLQVVGGVQAELAHRVKNFSLKAQPLAELAQERFAHDGVADSIAPPVAPQMICFAERLIP